MVISIVILVLLFILALSVSETFVTAALWVLFRLPFGLLLTGLGVLCCLTVILIPLGTVLLVYGMRVLK